MNLNSDKLPSLIIKSYLKFASTVNQPVWEPKVDNCDFGYEGSEQSDHEVAHFGEPSFPDFDEPPRISTPVPDNKKEILRRLRVAESNRKVFFLAFFPNL